MILTIAKITVESGSFYKLGTTKSDRYDSKPTTSSFYTQLDGAECSYREVFTRIAPNPGDIAKKVLSHPSVTKFLGADRLLVVNGKPVSGTKHNCFTCDNINKVVASIENKKDVVFVAYDVQRDGVVKVSIETSLPKVAFMQVPEDAAITKLEFFKAGPSILAKTENSVTFKSTFSLEELQGSSSYFQILELSENVYKCFCSHNIHKDAIFVDYSTGIYAAKEKSKIKSILPADIDLKSFFCKDVQGLIKEYLNMEDLPRFVHILKQPNMYKFMISTDPIETIKSIVTSKEPIGTTIEASIEIKPYITFEFLMGLVKPVGQKRNTFVLFSSLEDLVGSIESYVPEKARRMPSVYIVSFSKEGFFRVGLTESDILSKQSIPDGVVVYSKIVHNENIAMNVFDNMKGYEVKTEYPGRYYQGSLECLGKLMALVKS